MNIVGLGRITKVMHENKFNIRFTIDGYIEDAMAYPMDMTDVPEIGEPIVVFQLDTVFGQSFLYQKIRVRDFTRFKIGNTEVDLYDDRINITTGSNGVSINSDGSVNISTVKDISISGNNINIKTDGDTKLESTGTTTVKGDNVVIDGDFTWKGKGKCQKTLCPKTSKFIMEILPNT